MPLLYTHEDKIVLVCIVHPYMQGVAVCPRMYMVVQKLTSCV